jgi:proline iminopeptidase
MKTICLQSSFCHHSSDLERLLIGLVLLLMTVLLVNDFAAGQEIQHPRGAYAAVNGARIWYEIEGEGEPLLLIHGGPGSSHLNFHPYFSALADQHRVIYFDLFGRGKSDRAKSPTEYTFERDVADVEGLRKALGLETVNLLGFSYGGLVAQAYALEYPAHVKKLILVSTLYSGEMWQAKNENYIYEARNQFPETWEKIERLRAQGFRERSSELQAVDDIPAYELVFFYNPANAGKLRRDALSLNSEVTYAIAGDDADYVLGGGVARLDFRDRLKELKMPILIIAGRFDRLFPPKTSLQFKRYVPQAEFVMFEKSGHYPQIEETEKMFGVIKGFLHK